MSNRMNEPGVAFWNNMSCSPLSERRRGKRKDGRTNEGVQRGGRRD